jgi:hypothetical protein
VQSGVEDLAAEFLDEAPLRGELIVGEKKTFGPEKVAQTAHLANQPLYGKGAALLSPDERL